MPHVLKAILLWLLTASLVAGCGRGGGVMVDPAGTGGEVAVSVMFGDQPAPGAIVQLLDENQAPVGELKTDEEGKAVFKAVPAGGGYQAIATLDGATGKQADLRVSGGKTLATIVLSQNSGPVGLITGSVKLSGADRPLANVAVQVAGRTVKTDANGQFKLEGVPAGPVTVKATLNGYGPGSQNIVVKPGSSSPVALVLQPLASGPKAGRTVVATATQVFELDQWTNKVATYPAKQAFSAVFTPDGGVLVADAGANKVQTYTSSGSKGADYTAKTLLIFGGIKDPHGASRTPGGNALVADTAHNRVVEIDGSNKIVWEFKNGLNAPRWAERLANGNTLVVDSGNNRVIEIKSDGTIVWGLGDGSSDVLSNPTGAQRLPNGNTLVCDAGNGRVMEVNGQNQLVWMVPGRGDAGRLNNPNSARRLASGNTLIADTDNNRIIELDETGNVVWKAQVSQPLYADRF
jgi:hypothetical protein